MKILIGAVLLGASLLAVSPACGQNVKAGSTAPQFLQVGDVVKVEIWREKDLSGEFQIPENGVVVLPKIGEWKVTERAPEELKSALVAEYHKYLRNPSINITFLRRVNVLGAVKEPGVFPVDETMTIANVLALAGGTTPMGKPDEVQLFRKGEKLVTRITQQTRVSDLALQSGDQLYVPERSWMARNTGVVAAVISGMVSVAVAIIVNH
jgi:protein involved in polysaccharide export with SLBB domain